MTIGLPFAQRVLIMVAGAWDTHPALKPDRQVPALGWWRGRNSNFLQARYPVFCIHYQHFTTLLLRHSNPENLKNFAFFSRRIAFPNLYTMGIFPCKLAAISRFTAIWTQADFAFGHPPDTRGSGGMRIDIWEGHGYNETYCFMGKRRISTLGGSI